MFYAWKNRLKEVKPEKKNRLWRARLRQLGGKPPESLAERLPMNGALSALQLADTHRKSTSLVY